MFQTPAQRPYRARRRRVGLSCETLERREVLSGAGVVLSEVVPNPYPVRYPNQYVEIAGPANQSLAGVEFVQFDGYGNGHPTGRATFIEDLSSYSLGSNGLLIIEADTGGPAVMDYQTTVVSDPAFDAGSTLPGLGGGTKFFALVDTTNGTAIALNQSYDSHNTGTLTLPTNDTLVDAVSFVYDSQPSGEDRAYAVLQSAQGTRTNFPSYDFYLPVASGVTPDAASRVANDTTTVTPATRNSYNPTQHFYYGWLQPNSVFYDPRNSGGKMPDNDGAITPGGSNADLVVTFAQSSVSAAPGTNAVVDVIAGNGDFPTGGLNVNVSTSDGTAYAGTDYTPIFETLTFTNPSQPSDQPIEQAITIPILQGATAGNWFYVFLSGTDQGLFIVQPNPAKITIS
jgi:hypothetical protein